MTDPTTATEEPAAVAPPTVEPSAVEPAGRSAGTDEAASFVESDLLVEDVSIDGMCGVY